MRIVQKINLKTPKYEKSNLSFCNFKFIGETFILFVIPIPYYDCYIQMGTKQPGK